MNWTFYIYCLYYTAAYTAEFEFSLNKSECHASSLQFEHGQAKLQYELNADIPNSISLKYSEPRKQNKHTLGYMFSNVNVDDECCSTVITWLFF